MPLSKVLFDDTIELHLDMERVAIGSRATIIDLLKNLEQELIAKVADGVTDWSKARIAKQLSEADAVIRQYYDDAAGIARDTTTSVAQVSASATATSLSAAVGGQVAIGVLPTAAYLETLAGNTIIQGAVQADWWSRQAGDTAFKFQSAVRQGLVAAETTPQIIKRVREVLDLSSRNATTLVHTSVQSVANATREKIFDDNTDVVSGKEWCAALDRRTCPTCGVRDGKRWTTESKAIGHSIPYTVPPQHFRCRCSMIPVLKTWEELGIDMQELPDGTRASMDGQVNDKTFADWLKRKEAQTPGFADKTLGKGRAELFRDGKLTMDQMISGGKPLSLSDLQAKYGAPIIDDMEKQLKSIIGNEVYDNALSIISSRNLPNIISEAEQVALFAWTMDTSSNSIFKKINGSLRAGEDSKLNPIINLMGSALDKLPNYNGKIYRSVKRGSFSGNFPSFDAAHVTGKKVIYTGFTGASKNIESTLRGNIKFNISSKYGRDISYFSSNPDQGEVLFSPNSVFVIERRIDSGKAVELWLRELSLSEKTEQVMRSASKW